jgi:GT2 family glycosyltransferase
VIICAYTEARWTQLGQAITTARAHLEPGDETILVVDHNDRLLARAREEFPDVTVLPNRYQVGASGGRNTGGEAAHGEVLVFLDDDAVPEPDWLDRQMRWYPDPDIVAVGGAAHPAWEGGVRPSWLPSDFDWVVGCSYDGQPTEPTPVRNVWACNMSVRRAAFVEVGGFRDAIGGVRSGVTRGCEETELCIRLGESGTVFYDPESSVRHFVPIARQTTAYFRKRCYQEGESKYLVARMAGHSAATSTESDYARTVVARAFRQFWQGVGTADGRAVHQAALAMTGLLLAVAGYLGSWLRRPTSPMGPESS